MNDLSTNIAAFCAELRTKYRFSIGQAEAHDALRALETIGVQDEARVRSALRLVCCGTLDETLVFDRAFDAFFRPAARGAAQPPDTARHTRPGREKLPRTAERPADRPKSAAAEGPEGDGGTPAAYKAGRDAPDEGTAWQTLRARYSPLAAAQSTQLELHDHTPMLTAASRVISALRLGRSRRWKALDRGGRFDLRRSIRASLQTGGDPIDLRFLGHPRRNPRFVVLIDGSRSMSEQTGAVIAFARALCERSARVSVFVFSTELRDVTLQLRSTKPAGGKLADLGGAWGGGTKIGLNLDDFVVRHGPRLLTPDTLVVIFSDGLDTGDVPLLERAMRNIDGRSAGIVWLNPHAEAPGFAPTARGMRAALPFVMLLAAAGDAAGFAALADRLGRTARIVGRRR